MAGVGQCGSLKVRKCANPCVFTVNRSARGGAKASGVRRCVRSGLGAVSARGPSNSGHSFSLKFGVCSFIGGSNCRSLDAMAGEFNQQVAHT